MKHVMPTLTQGLIDCCKTRPEDPLDYLVCFGIFMDVDKQFVTHHQEISIVRNIISTYVVMYNSVYQIIV